MNPQNFHMEIDLRRKESFAVFDTGYPWKIPIIYEDNHLLLAIKPAGVLSQADASRRPDMLTLLKCYIRDKYNKPGDIFLGLVHRLDCPVEGLMVFGRTSKAASRLSEQIRRRSIEKRYFAVVEGKPPADQRILEDFLERNANRRAFISAQGKPCRLEYQLLEYNEHADVSLLSVLLHTGRTHQIRLQLSHLGNPVLGDAGYLADHPNDIDEKADRGASRLGLFSCFLSFEHPTQDLRMTFQIIPDNEFPWNQFQYF